MRKAKAKCGAKRRLKKRRKPEVATATRVDPPAGRSPSAGEGPWGGRKLTPKQCLFLAAYAGCGRVGAASLCAQVHRGDHCRWVKGQASYREAFAEARERAIETMEAEARRRAVEGVEETVFYQGTKCGTRRRYSDNLLMFLLKAARPDVYAERAQVAMEHRDQIALQFPELVKPGRAAARATMAAARVGRRTPPPVESAPGPRAREGGRAENRRFDLAHRPERVEGRFTGGADAS